MEISVRERGSRQPWGRCSLGELRIRDRACCNRGMYALTGLWTEVGNIGGPAYSSERVGRQVLDSGRLGWEISDVANNVTPSFSCKMRIMVPTSSAHRED